MTLVQGKFGSKCTFTEKFSKALEKCGIVESVLAWSKFKADQQKGKQSGKKTNKLRGIAKLEDANNAGTKFVAFFKIKHNGFRCFLTWATTLIKRLQGTLLVRSFKT